MAQGQSTANTFRFTPVRQSVTPSNIIERGLEAEEQLYGGPGPTTQDLPADMAQIEGVTSDVMNQWMEAKNFANTMWHNYRIDVTKPDSRNPLSVQANQAYMKAVAAIQYSGQKLKDYNKQLAYTDKEVSEGRGVYVQDPRKQYYSNPAEYFSSRTLDPTAMESNRYDGTDKTTEDAYTQSFIQTTAKRNELLRQAKVAENSGNVGLADELRYAASQIVDPKLEKPYQLDPNWLAQRQARAAKDEEDMMVFNESEQVRQGLANNDPNSVDRLQSIIFEKNGGRPVLVKPFTSFDSLTKGVKIFRTTQDGSKQVEKIVFDGDEAEGLKRINDYLNNLRPTKEKVSSDRLLQHFQSLKDTGYAPSQIAKPTKEFQTAVNDIRRVAYSLFEEGDTNGDEVKGGGNLLKGKTITQQQKQAFVDQLAGLAKQGRLLDDNGSKIVSVEWVDGMLNLDIDEGYETPTKVSIQPNGTTGNKQLMEILELNYTDLIDNISTQSTAPTRVIGTKDKVGNIDLRNMSADDIIAAHRASRLNDR